MKNTSLKVEEVFGDVISKDSISPEQITKLKFFSQNIVNINFTKKINLFKPKKKKILIVNQVLLQPTKNFIIS